MTRIFFECFFLTYEKNPLFGPKFPHLGFSLLFEMFMELKTFTCLTKQRKSQLSSTCQFEPIEQSLTSAKVYNLADSQLTDLLLYKQISLRIVTIGFRALNSIFSALFGINFVETTERNKFSIEYQSFKVIYLLLGKNKRKSSFQTKCVKLT